MIRRTAIILAALALSACGMDETLPHQQPGAQAVAVTPRPNPPAPPEPQNIPTLYEIGFAEFGKVCDEGRAVYLGREAGGGSSIAIVENAKECTPADGGA